MPKDDVQNVLEVPGGLPSRASEQSRNPGLLMWAHRPLRRHRPLTPPARRPHPTSQPRLSLLSPQDPSLFLWNFYPESEPSLTHCFPHEFSAQPHTRHRARPRPQHHTRDAQAKPMDLQRL